MENAGYLFAAFAIIWVVLFGHIFVLSRRQKKPRLEIIACLFLEEITGYKTENQAAEVRLPSYKHYI